MKNNLKSNPDLCSQTKQKKVKKSEENIKNINTESSGLSSSHIDNNNTASSIEEDKAESVDSGCFSDLSPETCWDQVGLALGCEYSFVLGLLDHTTKHTQEKTVNTSALMEETRKRKGKNLGDLQTKEQTSSTLEKRKKEKKKIKGEAISPHLDMKISAEEAKQIYSRCGKLVFSKLDFSHTVKEKWSNNRQPGLKTYLKNVLTDKEKVSSLQNEGKVNAAASLMEKRAWDKAMKRALGEKVKDDPVLLSRSLLKKEKQKKKSQAKWEDRKRMVQKQKDDRQEKRSHNLAKRKQSIMEKKKRGGKKKVVKGKPKGKGNAKRGPPSI